MDSDYSISLFTITHRDNREFLKELKYEFSRCHMPPNSWLVSVLQEMSRQSVLKRFEFRGMEAFNKVIGACIGHERCYEQLRRPINEIGRGEVMAFFHAIDEALTKKIGGGVDQFQWSDATATANAGIVRRWMIRYLDKTKLRQDITATVKSFRSKFRTFFRSRQVISDEIDSTYPNELASPIDALPHKSIKELKELQHNRLSSDLQRFVDAGMQELAIWREARSKLLNLATLPISNAKKSKFAHIFFSRSENKETYDFQEYSPEELLGCAAWFSLQKKYAIRVDRSHLRTPAVREAIRSVLGITKSLQEGITVGQIAFMCQRAVPRELTAAFVLMLTQTGWNSAVLGQLTTDRIAMLTIGEYRIDSFKTKNGRNQPDVLIERNNLAGKEALEFLIWNNEQMRTLGLIRTDEKRLFFSWGQRRQYPLTEPMRIKNHLKTFIKLYKLPAITLEQIRTTVLLKATYAENNLAMAQTIAGHLGINTTGGYVINQMMRVKLGKAINLEFQRRLDNSVLYAIREKRPSLPRKENPRYVSEELLFNIGDGTSCLDPSDPPKIEWKTDGGSCDGLRCHQGDGCPNNKIILNKDRLEEVFRLEIYYRDHWQQLMEENIDAFEAYHGPAMLFNIALADHVRQGMYWSEAEMHLKDRGIL